MNSKAVVDFKFDELSLAILEKEPSLEDLRRKALILLRGAIVALGRIEIVVDAMSNESYRDYFHISRVQMNKVAGVTGWLNQIDFFADKSTPAEQIPPGIAETAAETLTSVKGA